MTRCLRCHRRLPPKGECDVHGRPSIVASIAEDEPVATRAPDGWRLGRQIACGGSSFVYAVTATNGAPAVLKIGRTRDAEMRARFVREAEVMKALGSPAAPAYLAHGELDGRPYLVMEDVPGETLAPWLSRAQDRGALGEIVAILLRIVAAVRVIHERGFVHRDLKPENLVVGARDARVLDFGLAAPTSAGLTQIGAILGTVHYLAPEQIRIGASIDQRADLYSLGVIAFEMIAGQPPFAGERRAIEYQHQLVRPPVLGELREVPPEIEGIVMACLAKQPEGRPKSAAELEQWLLIASGAITTTKGLGFRPVKRHLGNRDRVVLVWLEGGDVVTVARAISDVHGMIVRSRPGAILAAFASSQHEAPLASALALCREVASERCRAVVHMTEALVRRSAQGKPTFYGPELEHVEQWTPKTPFTGVVLTAEARTLAGDVAADPHVPGFWSAEPRDAADPALAHRTPAFVGRESLVVDICAVVRHGGILVGISGRRGAGKSRMLHAIAERLRTQHRDVMPFRARRRRPGEHDDARLVQLLGAADLASGLAALDRRRVLIVDDVQHLSPECLRALLSDELAASRVLASRDALVEAVPGSMRRLAFDLQPLARADSERMLRDLLQPAHLIPEVLLERLAIRAGGNPRLLVALARDLIDRGALRKQAGSDDWYIAVDEQDTLVPPPDEAWLASRTLDRLPPDLVPIVRAAAALGPTFTPTQLAAATGVAELDAPLAWLLREQLFELDDGAYAFVDPDLQATIQRGVR